MNNITSIVLGLAMAMALAACSGSPQPLISVGNPLEQEGTGALSSKSAKWGIELRYQMGYAIASEDEDSVLFRSGDQWAEVRFSFMGSELPADTVASEGEFVITDQYVVVGSILVWIQTRTRDGSIPVTVATGGPLIGAPPVLGGNVPPPAFGGGDQGGSGPPGRQLIQEFDGGAMQAPPGAPEGWTPPADLGDIPTEKNQPDQHQEEPCDPVEQHDC